MNVVATSSTWFRANIQEADYVGTTAYIAAYMETTAYIAAYMETTDYVDDYIETDYIETTDSAGAAGRAWKY